MGGVRNISGNAPATAEAPVAEQSVVAAEASSSEAEKPVQPRDVFKLRGGGSFEQGMTMAGFGLALPKQIKLGNTSVGIGGDVSYDNPTKKTEVKLTGQAQKDDTDTAEVFVPGQGTLTVGVANDRVTVEGDAKVGPALPVLNKQMTVSALVLAGGGPDTDKDGKNIDGRTFKQGGVGLEVDVFDGAWGQLTGTGDDSFLTMHGKAQAAYVWRSESSAAEPAQPSAAELTANADESAADNMYNARQSSAKFTGLRYNLDGEVVVRLDSEWSVAIFGGVSGLQRLGVSQNDEDYLLNGAMVSTKQGQALIDETQTVKESGLRLMKTF